MGRRVAEYDIPGAAILRIRERRGHAPRRSFPRNVSGLRHQRDHQRRPCDDLDFARIQRTL